MIKEKITMSEISFWQFLNDRIVIGNSKTIQHPYIKIPLIQRDYVEGRKKSNGKIEGENFLNTIFDTIQTRELMLDYIYGNIEGAKDGDNEGLTFSPLDGQQRLTTLFLLYWYIGEAELKEDKIKYESIMKSLRRFTYETRVTAKDFCKMLCSIENFDPNEESWIGIKNYIQGNKEFYYDYNIDPTIQNMLEVLSKIEEIYKKNKKKYYEKLNNIKFDVLIMDDFGLTDELYIKMNARGKKLTDFENFKADFIDFLTKKINDANFEVLMENYTYRGRQCSYIEKISWKLDNEWSDCIWENICEKDKTKIDEYLKKIVYIYFLNIYDRKNINQKIRYNNDDNRTFLSGFYEYDNFTLFEKLITNGQVIVELEKFLDCFVKYYKEIKSNSVPAWNNEFNFCHFNNSENGDSEQKIEFKELLNILAVELFFAKSNQLSFDKNEGFYDFNQNCNVIETLKKWMRVVNNIIENSDVDSEFAYRSCRTIINQLSNNVDDIYNNLATTNNQFTSSKDAIEEEQLKCSLINNNPKDDFESILIEFEKNSFLRGSIYFIIDQNITLDVLKHRLNIWKELYIREKEFKQCSQGRDKLLIKNLIKETMIDTKVGNKEVYHFVDFDEKEHFLKKSLRANQNLQTFFKQLLDQNNIKSMENLLNSNLKNISKLEFVKKVLINNDDLIDWTFVGQRYYYKIRYNQFSVGTTKASVKWVSLNEERYKIQEYLFNKGFSCDNRVKTTNFVDMDEVIVTNNDKSFVLKKDGSIIYKEDGKSEITIERIKKEPLNYIDNHCAFSVFEKFCQNNKI